MQKSNLEKIKEILSKDIDKRTITKAMTFTEEKYYESMSLFNLKDWEDSSKEDKIKVILSLGLGRDRTASVLSEFKVNRDHIKEAKNSMNEEQTEFRIKNENVITNFKIESTKRNRRMKAFRDACVKWETIAERYSNGEPINKLSKEYNVKVNFITEQLKDDGLHDETRSTLLKNKIALESESEIDNKFIIELVKGNPLDSKDLWWEKAKERYPWILRKQFFDKLLELGLERTKEEVNEIRRIKNERVPEISKKRNRPTEKQISPQEIKANTLAKVNEVFGSLENLVKLYMSNKLGSYSKIAKHINTYYEGQHGVEVSTRQVEKAISRHPNYIRKQSLPEGQLFEYVKRVFPNYETHREYQIPNTLKRIDVFIEDLNVGIEFNGDYYHSDEVIMYNYGKTAEEQHRERAEDALKSGIKLVYVWERDWNINFQEVEDAIANQDWDNPLLNRYSNSDYHRKVKPPTVNKSNSKKKE